MKRLSLRGLALLAPKPIRKFVRYRLLPKGVARRLGKIVDKETQASDPARPRVSARPMPGQRPPAKWYSERLWGGFSQEAAALLEARKRDPRSTPKEASEAARALGLWHVSRCEFEEAYENAVFSRVAYPKVATEFEQFFLETDSLLGLGRNDDARVVVDAALKNDPTDPAFLLTKANTLVGFDGSTDADKEDERLAWINRALVGGGLAPLERKDPSLPLSIYNLAAPTAECAIPADDQPMVSVLMPSYLAKETLWMAVESLLKQTWQKLEIVIVDDQSTDGTFETAQRLASEHEQVSAYQLAENRGAYSARNEALRRAKGEFITVHDADDWSHPQKIELQVRQLLDNPASIVNCSEWVRCHANLFLRAPPRSSSRRVGMNHSSVMLRRAHIVALGGWDEVRASADSEFLRRVQRAHGLKATPRVKKGYPLSFALTLDSSLTRRGPSHVFTLYHGVRRTYHEAAEHWRETRGKETNWAFPQASEGRPFPVPNSLLPAPEAQRYDLLFIMDFRMEGGAYASTLDYVLAAIALGKRVALLHWRHFDLDNALPPASQILELAQTRKVDLLAPGFAVDAELVIVGYPAILAHPIDLAPTLRTKKLFVITSHMNSRLSSGGDVQYDPLETSRKVKDLFGIEPIWIPISERVRGMMAESGQYAPIHHQTWTPLIDTSTWSAAPVRYRGPNLRPVVGRHACDASEKWPTTPQAIKSAYCAEQEADVRLLGGAAVPKSIIGHLPQNWTVYEAGELEAQAFLRELDFFVHFLHDDHIPEFGRAVIEAMAVGLPVILPAVFQTTFGSAALYAEPAQVWPLIERIWKDEELWQGRSRAGLRFVKENSDWRLLSERLKALP